MGTNLLLIVAQAKGSGWFNSTVWAKLRVIMRDKIALLIQGETPNDDEYRPLAKLPNKLDRMDMPKNDKEILSKHFNAKQMTMLKDIRTVARQTTFDDAEPSSRRGSEDARTSLSVAPGVI